MLLAMSRLLPLPLQRPRMLSVCLTSDGRFLDFMASVSPPGFKGLVEIAAGHLRAFARR